MRVLRTFALISVFTLLSNLSFSQSLIGRYKNHLPSRLEQALLLRKGVTRYVMSLALELRNDSTFVFADCRTVKYGKWECRKNQLFLYPQRSDRANLKDSFDNMPVVLSPIVYHVRGQKLEQVQSGKFLSKTISIFERQ